MGLPVLIVFLVIIYQQISAWSVPLLYLIVQSVVVALVVLFVSKGTTCLTSVHPLVNACPAPRLAVLNAQLN